MSDAILTNQRRFEFGKNWQQFLRLLDEDRVETASRSLLELLELPSLEGKRFLDIGCGSGLFSLAARRCGATVHSFDYDENSVDCALELKRRFFPNDERWEIELGSVLDDDYLKSLGTFDVVYSWGVLHHTGEMWRALEYAMIPVSANGLLTVSIYNDQGGASRRWLRLKRFYVRLPVWLRPILVAVVGGYFESRAALIRALRLQNPLPFSDWAAKKRDRGMSVWYDLVDWVGGYPFEVAKPEKVFDFYRGRGMTLRRLITQGCGHGCNEFVFERSAALPNQASEAATE